MKRNRGLGLVPTLLVSATFPSVAIAHPGDGIVVTADGTVFFTDVGRQTIRKLSPDGALEPARTDRWTHGLMLAGDRTLYDERELQGEDAWPASFRKITPAAESLQGARRAATWPRSGSFC